jgi:hypothetical protein
MVTKFGEIKKVTVFDNSRKADIEFDPNPPGGALETLHVTNDKQTSYGAMVSVCTMGFAFGTPGHPNVHVTYDTSDNEIDKIEIHRL